MKTTSSARSPQPLYALAFLSILTTAAHAEPASHSARLAEVDFYELEEKYATGLGFLSDGKTLYPGGCKTFDLTQRRYSDRCIFPKNILYSSVSPDGSLILATALETGSRRLTSYQLDSRSGSIISTRLGDWFSGPVAVNPSNSYWATSKASRHEGASDTIMIIKRDWTVLRKDIYANTKTIFSFKFSQDGSILVVNSGSSLDGADLSTRTWKAIDNKSLWIDPAPGVVAQSTKSNIDLKISDESLTLSNSNGETIGKIDLDVNFGQPEATFSQDENYVAAKGIATIAGRKIHAFALARLSH